MAQRPPWLLSFLFRWLLCLFGFGKLKFSGHSSRDNGYIKGFLIYQPIPSIFGWLGEALPVIFHKIALIGMFAIEIVAPFFLFFPAQSQENVIPWRAVASAHFIALMFGIQLCGNFGHFNVLTVGLSLPFLFETSPTTSSVHDAQTGNTALYILYAYASFIVMPMSVAHLPFNSWVGQTWAWWQPYFSAMMVPFLRSTPNLCERWHRLDLSMPWSL